MIKITYQEDNLSISYDLQGEPTQKEIIDVAIFVLERGLGEESVQKHLKDYVRAALKVLIVLIKMLQAPLI